MRAWPLTVPLSHRRVQSGQSLWPRAPHPPTAQKDRERAPHRQIAHAFAVVVVHGVEVEEKGVTTER